MYKDTDLRGMKPSGTFVVKILAKENNTWQGSVVWAEGNQKQYFRSAVELLKLMDSALAKDVFEKIEDEI